jgi:hypothetical protein
MLVEASPIPNAFINEIHYDNLGLDKNESVEVVGDADLDLTDWSLHLYNGFNGSQYNVFSLDEWAFIDTDTNVGLLTINTLGIQNGSPDGIMLYDGESVIQFLSYEGVFTATSGIGIGLTSTNISVTEASLSPIGFSLQLSGKGNEYADFTWNAAQENTFGRANTGQYFINNNSATQVNEPNSLILFTLVIFIFLLVYFQTK